MKTGRRAPPGQRGAEAQSKRPIWGVKRKDEKAESFLSPTLPSTPHPRPCPKTSAIRGLGAGDSGKSRHGVGL